MNHHRVWLLAGLLALVASSGCDDGSDGDADSDADQDVDHDDDLDLEIEPPAPPAPPVLTPCPDGWVEVPSEDPSDPYDVATCDPWPEEGPAKLTPCPQGWVEIPRTEPGGVATCDPWPEEGPAQLTPCPAGWREIPRTEPGGVATCDPWPEGRMQECEGAEAHFPGEPGCRRIGSECPAGDWADGLPETGVLYVRANATPGGTGTRASPFGTIAEATAVATEGTTLALSKGRFDEAVVAPAGVTLRGACVRDTVVAWSGAAETDATITVHAAGATLRDLTIGGEGQGVLVEAEGASLEVEGLLVQGARRAGVFVRDSATLTGQDLVVRATRGTREPDPEFPDDDVTMGYGLRVGAGGRAELDRVVLAGNHDVGLMAHDTGTVLRLSDAAVVGTQGQEWDQAFGYGLSLWGRVNAELRRVAVERNHMFGVLVSDAGTDALLEDVVVRDTEGQVSDGVLGVGLLVRAGAHAASVCALLERNRAAGVLVTGAESLLALDDAVVRDTEAQASDGTAGFGLDVFGGAAAQVSRAVLQGNRGAALLVSEAGTSVLLEDAVVRDTEGLESDATFGRGLEVGLGARAEVARLLVERSRLAGIAVVNPESALVARDVVVRDTEAQESDELEGFGLSVADGARVEVARGLFERNHDLGVVAWMPGTALVAEDLVVRDTQPGESDGTWGSGVQVSHGAEARISRALVERSRSMGVVVARADTSAVIEDLLVRDSVGQESDGIWGTGLEVSAGARAEVSHALLERNRGVGLLVGGAGTSSAIEDLVVRDTVGQASDGTRGHGLEVNQGAGAHVTRALVEGNRGVGVIIGHAGTAAAIRDLVVRETQAEEATGHYGIGLQVGLGASAELIRGLLERNRVEGVVTWDPGTVFVIEDLVVRDTQKDETSGGAGLGLQVAYGSRVELVRGLFERNRDTGVAAWGPDAEITASDVEIRDTLRADCWATTCADLAWGMGVGAYGGGHVDMSRFRVSGSALCGVQLGYGRWENEQGELVPFEQGGTMDLHEGEVSNNLVGANVTTEGFDLRRLMDRVIWRDNGRNLDTNELPVPELALPPEW